MELELDSLVVAVRADTRGLKQSVESARGDFDALAVGASSAARRMENAFEKFLRTGNFSFESLRSLALGVLNDIANAAIRTLLDGIFGSSGKTGGSFFSSLLSSFSLSGRATGGDVQQGRGYVVGEHGPELFVPNQFGRVQTFGGAPERAVAVTINLHGSSTDARSMSRSADQIAVAVRRALAQSTGLA